MILTVQQSLIAQQVDTIEQLKQIAKDKKWTEEALFAAISERFQTKRSMPRVYEQYLDHLSQSGFEEHAVHLIDENVKSTIKRMKNRQNAMPDGRQVGYGLVVGRIQSGKTAHMLGTALLSLDHTLNKPRENTTMVIILSGLIEDLRIQTLGRAMSTSVSGIVIQPEIDFKPSEEENKQFFRDTVGNSQTVIIVKKNHQILEELINILNEDDLIEQLVDERILIIDDECDHASIDSNHAESVSGNHPDEITRTNRAVRSLIQVCSVSRDPIWYLGYTATPYSNLLMSANPSEVQLNEFGLSLFPRDMIHNLEPQPAGHFDNETIFEQNGEPYLVNTTTPLPMSLAEERLIEELILEHMITRLIRKVLSEGNFHHTTMIHTSVNVDDHLRIAEKVSERIEAMRDLVDSDLEHRIQTHCEMMFPAHINELNIALSKRGILISSPAMKEISDIKVVKLNSDASIEEDINLLQYPDELRYNDSKSESIIVVGGYKLSRGLTLEGLTISWMARTPETPRYDTLLQMARWCGFRESHQSLIRIHMPPDIIENYAHITEVETRLRSDLNSMDESTNPLDNIQWIREYQGMMVSGKIPNDVQRRFSPTSGLLPEFHLRKLPNDHTEECLIENQQLSYDSFIDLMNMIDLDDKSVNGFQIARDIDKWNVADFLRQIQSSYQQGEQMGIRIEQLCDTIENESVELRWNIALKTPEIGRIFDGYVLSRNGYLNEGLRYIRSGSTAHSLIDLNQGLNIRVNPLIVIHLEDPSHTISGMPIYQDNEIPIPMFSCFLPTSIAPTSWSEIARPIEEEE